MRTIAITARHLLFKDRVNFNNKSIVPNSILTVLGNNNIRVITVHSLNEIELACCLCDGLILTGSSIDIDPYYWGEGDKVSSDIDEFVIDKELISKFIEMDKPIFGICGGMQSLNVACGGSLHRVNNHRNVCHSVNIENTSIFKEYKLNVNSFHSWAVDRLGNNLKCIAKSDDVIEAIESKNSRLFGVQWHPEESGDLDFYIKHLLSLM